MKNSYLLDATIIGHWLLHKDAQSQHIDSLIQDYLDGKIALFISELTPYEMGNVLHYCVTDPDLSKKLFRAFLSLHIPVEKVSDTIAEHALTVSSTYGTSFYDASYHSIAIAKNYTFLTRDSSYAKRTESLGNITVL